MFRFESPIYLYCLLLIPLFAAAHYIMLIVRKRSLERFGDKELMLQLMPRRSRIRGEIKFWLSMSALMVMCFLLARPQYGMKTEKRTRQGIEAVICLDVSRSMLAEDVTPSRLDKAKMLVSSLVDNMNDDKIGMIVFAGDAFTQLPITSDYVSAKMFLDNISPDMIDVQGTDIAHALDIAMRSFTPDETASKAIVIITDGENHEGGAEEAAAEASKKGINIYVMGVGSPNGAPIPTTRGSNDFIVDETGRTVVSSLNEDMCRKIAQAGNGAYIYVDNSSSAQRALFDHVDRLAKKDIETLMYSEFDEQFQPVAFILLVLLLIEVCVMEAKNPFFSRFRLWRRGTVAVIMMMTFSMSASAQNTANDYIRRGNRCYRDSDFVKSDVYYHKAIDADGRSGLAYYNLGCSRLQQHKAKEAMEAFEHAVKIEKDPSRLAKAYHNMGVILQSQKQLKEAMQCYMQSLINNPHDDETRYNFVLCQRQLKEDENNQNQDNKQDENGNDEKDEKQQGEQEQKDQPEQQEQNQEQQQQPKENEMSKENAEQMLQAAMQDERQTQDKMKKQQVQPQRRRLQKQW